MDISMNVIGWIATVFSILMYAPQSWKVLKNKSAEGISKPSFLIVTIGTAIWIVTGPLGNSWQGWACNSVIVLMMIPIIFYVFKDKKSVFWAVIALIVVAEAAAIALWVIQLSHGITPAQWLNILFVVLAGGLLSFALVPQGIKVFKTKEIGNYSLLSSTLVITGQVLWVAYWALKMAGDMSDHTNLVAFDIIALVTSVLPLVMPASIMGMYYHQKAVDKKAAMVTTN